MSRVQILTTYATPGGSPSYRLSQFMMSKSKPISIALFSFFLCSVALSEWFQALFLVQSKAPYELRLQTQTPRARKRPQEDFTVKERNRAPAESTVTPDKFGFGSKQEERSSSRSSPTQPRRLKLPAELKSRKGNAADPTLPRVKSEIAKVPHVVIAFEKDLKEPFHHLPRKRLREGKPNLLPKAINLENGFKSLHESEDTAQNSKLRETRSNAIDEADAGVTSTLYPHESEQYIEKTKEGSSEEGDGIKHDEYGLNNAPANEPEAPSEPQGKFLGTESLAFVLDQGKASSRGKHERNHHEGPMKKHPVDIDDNSEDDSGSDEDNEDETTMEIGADQDRNETDDDDDQGETKEVAVDLTDSEEQHSNEVHDTEKLGNEVHDTDGHFERSTSFDDAQSSHLRTKRYRNALQGVNVPILTQDEFPAPYRFCPHWQSPESNKEILMDDTFEYWDTLFKDSRRFHALTNGKSCAIVGSSGILKSSSFGQDISDHDTVIRFGLASIRNKSMAGNRTDLLWINPSTAGKISSLKMWIHKPKLIMVSALQSVHYAKIRKIKSRRPEALDVEVGPLNCKFFRGIRPFTNSTVKRVPSAGLQSVLWGLRFCKRVDVYGIWPFSKDCDGEDVSYHYFDRLTPVGNTHDARLEVEFYHYLEKHERELGIKFKMHLPENARCTPDATTVYGNKPRTVKRRRRRRRRRRRSVRKASED